ncbi:MAG TPA: hypothetical protein VFW92_00830 [Candidatus Limnocylindrales bacterium]|nr:hypothetical protein [Candidatus Limnocylindrales bacterium]
MRSALAAEWLRLRRRRDLLLLLIALPVLVVVGLVTSYQGISSSFGFPPGPTPAEVLAAIAERQAGYAFPASISTAFGFGPILALIGILLGAFLLGAEFGWGTLRGALLADGRRGHFLVARWIALVGLMVLLVLEIAVCGPITTALLGVLGSPPPATQITLGQALLSVAVWLAAASALAILGATAALFARSAAGGILVAFLYAFAELLISGAQIFQQPPLDVVRGISLTGSVVWLSTASQNAGRPEPAGGVTPPPVPPEVSAVALVAWIVGLSLLAAWRMARLDVVE